MRSCTQLIWGDTGSATGNAVAVDTSGNAYFVGTASAFQTTSGALNNCCAFVEKLSTTGGEVYGAQIGATQGLAIAVDSLGAAYIAGTTSASSFPSSPPGARTTNAGGFDAYAAKLSPDATSLTFATFLGGSGNDSANTITLGTGNVVYFGGSTASSNLPVTTGVVQGTYGGGSDAFVASLNAAGSSFGFVTYLGGGKSDALTSIAVGGSGLILAGNTFSRNFPVANAIQPAFPGSPYAFFKSTNSGASFTSTDSGLPTLNAGVILPDPSTAGTIVLDSGQGIFRSTDDGATWTNVEPSSNGATARSLASPSVLYSADQCSLYKSTNGGATWNTQYTNCAPIPAPNFYLVAISPTNSSVVLLFSGTTEYISTDGGSTFPTTVATAFLPTQVVASPDGSLYAVAGSGLFKSTNAGASWTQLGNGAPGNPVAVAVSTSTPATVYASDGSNVYQSTNSGANWTLTGLGTAVNYLAVDPTHPQTIYGASPQSALILTSTNGGVTWTSTAALLDTDFIQGLAVSPSNASELYVSNYVPQSGFVSNLSTNGTTLTWSTFYGPYDQSYLAGAAVAPSGNVWVAGSVQSESLPLTPNARNANTYASGTAFLAEIAATTASCSYSINPATQYSYLGERLAFTVTAPSGCAWTAATSDSWIHLIRTSGTGSGTIPLAVDANTATSSRDGSVSVGGQTYTIVQPGSSCLGNYQLSADPSLGSAGGTATFTLTAPAGCPWDVQLQNERSRRRDFLTHGNGQRHSHHFGSSQRWRSKPLVWSSDRGFSRQH